MAISIFALVRLFLILTCFAMIPSCASSPSGTGSPMIGANYSFEQLELVHKNSETVVTDVSGLQDIREILSRSKQIEGTLETLEFAEMKKLRLINYNPEDHRIYIVDLQNGYATVASKAVMPVYQISDVDGFKRILNESGVVTPNAG